MGKTRPVCQYIMQDRSGQWCLCRHERMFLCEEWVRKRAGVSLFPRKEKGTDQQQIRKL